MSTKARRILCLNLRNLSEIDETELIKIPIKNEIFENNVVEFVLDTGAQANLIKQRALKSSAYVNPSIKYDLVGVGAGVQRTLGQVEIELNGVISQLQVVSNNFPIKQEGLVGLPFFRRNKINLIFDHESGEEGMIIGEKFVPFAKRKNSFSIPARTKLKVNIALQETDRKYGYIRKLNVGPGVHVGEALVCNKEGFAQIYVTNSNAENLEISLPKVELEGFSEIPAIVQESQKPTYICNDAKKAARFAEIVKLLDLENLTTEERNSVFKLVFGYPEQFFLKGDKLGHTNKTKHKISVTSDKPFNTKQYRHPQIHKQVIADTIKGYLDDGIIEPSDSPCNSPVFIIPKKADKDGKKRWRMVIDYRKLNEITVPDKYPLPNVTEVLDQLGNARYFSVLDLHSGFLQIPLDEQSRYLSAFSTPFGHHHFTRLPFGMSNAPATFQRLMDTVLSGLQGVECYIFMDDIVVYAETLKEHDEKMHKLMGRLKEANLVLAPEKCQFLRREVAYLGHIISENGVKPCPKKIEAVKNFPVPRCKKDVKSFLGLVGYYRRFIKNMARIAKPLTVVTKEHRTFFWGQEQQKSFERLRDLICTEPILQFPDFSRPFVVTTDASNFAIGAVLSQGVIGSDRPIAYASRTLSPAECNLSTTEKEMLAIIWAVEYFRPYLYGNNFTLVTDHKPLTWLYNVKKPHSKLIRWRLKLSEYQFDIVYKPGRINSNADALSRNPVDNVWHGNSDKVNMIDKNSESLSAGAPQGILHCASQPSSAQLQHLSEQSDDVEALVSRIFLMNLGVTTAGEAPNLGEGTGGDTGLTSLNPPGPQVRAGSFQANDDSEQETVMTIAEEPGQTSSRDRRVAIQLPNLTLEAGDMANVPLEDGHTKKSRVVVDNMSASLGVSCGGKRAHGLLAELEVLTIEGGGSPRKRINLAKVGVDEFTRHVMITSETVVDNKSASSEVECTSQSVLILSGTCINYSTDNLLFRRDNLVNFISADLLMTTKINNALMKEGMVDMDILSQIKRARGLRVGEIITLEQNRRKIFNVVVKLKFDSRPTLVDVEKVIGLLKKTTEQLKIKSFSLSRNGVGLDRLSWSSIEKHVKSHFGNAGYKITICSNEVRVPLEENIPQIIKENHDSTVGGHQGVEKLYARIREKFFWNGMKEQIAEYVESCEVCQRNKLCRKKTKLPMKITDTPLEAFDKVQMDIVGPLPVTERRNKYLLTLQDCLTKYSDAIPMVDAESVTVATALAEQFISRFGCPKVIQTDQGSQFCSKLTEQLCKIFGIRHMTSTAWHPESLGALERSHMTFVEYLRCYANKENWDVWIRFCIFSFNTTKHSATQKTPHELIFGRTALVPSEFAEMKVEKTFIKYVDDLLHRLETTQATARQNCIKAKLKYKEIYDKALKEVNFKIGDKVYLLKEPRSQKLDPHWDGVYTIIKLFSDYNAEIDLGDSKTKIVHLNKLKHAFIRGLPI